MGNKWTLAVGLAAFILVAGLLGNEDVKEAEAQQERYCEMVEIWKQSGGDTGWPPYKGECSDD